MGRVVHAREEKKDEGISAAKVGRCPLAFPKNRGGWILLHVVHTKKKKKSNGSCWNRDGVKGRTANKTTAGSSINSTPIFSFSPLTSSLIFVCEFAVPVADIDIDFSIMGEKNPQRVV